MDITEFQKIIGKHGYDAYILTRGNMFLGQDVLPAENKLREITGFSGSAGTLIATPERAFLLVDGRYELQAAQEVDTSLIRVVCTNDTIGTWINNNFLTPLKIAYNPWCHSVNEVDYWQRALKKHTFIEDAAEIAGSRICNRETSIFEHELEFCGVSTEEKISYLTAFINQNGLDAYFIAECDAVSWLLNLRSDCLPDTPVLRAFALVDKDGEVSLFTSDMQKIETEIAAYKGRTVGMAYAKTPKKVQTLMKNRKIWLENIPNPIEGWKAVKNPVELDGIKKAHIRDGVAMVNFLCWLEQNWQNQDELGIVRQLRQYRAAQKNFYSDSFGTIAAFGPNGAIVHYQPAAATNRKLKPGSVLLLDSGAQYYDGTTDITRTIALGIPDEEIINSFTQVLKAHIAVADAYFPDKTPGCALDALARAQLWKFGKEYRHGTGHGVGCFLSVHEGPFSLSPKNSQPLSAGMVSSIEPGFYKEGSYGIRIENLAYITGADIPGLPEPMLKFEPLTLAPLDKSLINKYLLTAAEIKWLDSYHATVYRKLHPHLTDDAAQWLRQACAPL